MIDARFCFAHFRYEYCVNSLLFSFPRRLRHILHRDTLAGVLFDVLLEIVLFHLQIAHKAVMDGYALDAVLAFAMKFVNTYHANQFLEKRCRECVAELISEIIGYI